MVVKLHRPRDNKLSLFTLHHVIIDYVGVTDASQSHGAGQQYSARPEDPVGTPVAFSDASNDSDPLDGLCQFGFTVMMSGGPVIYKSSKLRHKSPTGSASHCEYMALCHCNQAVVWLRQLLFELGFTDLLERPTVVYGDNKQANTLCVEDIVTSGNQYIYLPYHFNKEVCEQGFVEVRDVRTALNVADLFTKPVPQNKIRDLLAQLLGYKPIDFVDVNRGFVKT